LAGWLDHAVKQRFDNPDVLGNVDGDEFARVDHGVFVFEYAVKEYGVIGFEFIVLVINGEMNSAGKDVTHLVALFVKFGYVDGFSAAGADPDEFSVVVLREAEFISAAPRAWGVSVGRKGLADLNDAFFRQGQQGAGGHLERACQGVERSHGGQGLVRFNGSYGGIGQSRPFGELFEREADAASEAADDGKVVFGKHYGALPGYNTHLGVSYCSG